MAIFDIYQYGEGYVLNVQSDLVHGLTTVLMVPLLPLEKAPKPMGRLNPIFELGGRRYSMVTQFMAATQLRGLGAPSGNLKLAHYDEIRSALDMIFLGF